MKKVFLHIGYPKTGTTSIQFALNRHSDALKGIGVCYPQTGKISSNGAHHLLTRSINELADFDMQGVQQLLVQLRTEIDASPCRFVILSSEDFVRLFMHVSGALGRFSEWFSNYDYHFVCFLRNTSSYLESMFFLKLTAFLGGQLQRKLNTLDVEIAADLNRPKQHLAFVTEVLKMPSRDKFIFLPYVPNKDSLIAFFEAIDLHRALDIPGITNAPKSNVRLNRDIMSLAYLISIHDNWQELQLLLIENAKKLLARSTPEKGGLFIFNNEQRKQLTRNTLEIFEAVEEAFSVDLSLIKGAEPTESEANFLVTLEYSKEFLSLVNEIFLPSGFNLEDHLANARTNLQG